MMHIEACLRIRDKTITSFSGQGGIKGMASNREYLDFILEQFSGLANITYRAMMGEFILRMIREEPVLKVQYPRYKPYLDTLEV